MSRDAQRIAALEAAVIQLLAQRHGPQISGARNLANFGDHMRDIAGASEAIDSLLTQAERRRQYIEKNGIER